MRLRSRTILITGACLLLSLLLLPLGLCLLNPTLNRALYSEKPFDSSAWKAGGVRQRGRMARNLDNSGILLGKTREEVIDMLGLSDADDGSMTYRYVHGDLLGGMLGLPFAEWGEYVFIAFDSEGRVKYTQCRD